MHLIGIGVATLVGLAAAVSRPLTPLPMSIALTAALLVVVLGWRTRPLRAAGLLLVACALGALRPTLWPLPTTDALAPLVGARITVLGQVATVPERRGQVITFRARSAEVAVDPRESRVPAVVQPDGAQVEVVATAQSLARRLHLGDWVSLEGRLREPDSPAGFPRAEILRRQGVFSVLSFPRVTLLERPSPDPGLLVPWLRTEIRRGFERHLPHPHAPLAAGILLGGSADLGPAFRQQVQAAGLGHLVAVSGYNVAVVAGLLMPVAARLFGRRFALYPVLAAIALYTLLAGAPPSAIRAALMVGAALVAGAVGRIADPLTSLVLVATGMAVIQPPLLLDISFQLSVAATLGLVLLLPRLRPFFGRLPAILAVPLAVSLAAIVATLPVVLVVFRQVSLVAPLANLLAAPLVPAIMLASAALTAVLPLPLLPTAAAWLVLLPTALLVELARVAGDLPFASIYTGQVPVAAGYALGGLLLLWGLLGLPEATSLRAHFATLLAARSRPVRVLAGVTLVAVLANVAVLMTRPDGLLHVTTLAAGRGSALFVRSPTGTTTLVVPASVEPRGLATLLAEQLNAWEITLDALVLPDAAHEDAVSEVVRRYRPRTRVLPGQDARLDLGGGAILDVFGAAEGDPAGGVWLRYHDLLVRLAGADPGLVAYLHRDALDPAIAPPPVLAIGRQAAAAWRDTLLLPPPREGALELVTDGQQIWPTDPLLAAAPED